MLKVVCSVLILSLWIAFLALTPLFADDFISSLGKPLLFMLGLGVTVFLILPVFTLGECIFIVFSWKKWVVVLVLFLIFLSLGKMLSSRFVDVLFVGLLPIGYSLTYILIAGCSKKPGHCCPK